MGLSKVISSLVGASIILSTFAGTASVATTSTEDAINTEDILSHVTTKNMININSTELEEAYGYALSYVHESRMAWVAQFEEKYWSSRSQELNARFEAAQYDLQLKTEMAEEAEESYQESRERLAEWARSEHKNTTVFELPVGAEALSKGTGSMREAEDEYLARKTLTQVRANDFAQAESNRKDAQTALISVREQSDLLQDMSKESTSLSSQSTNAAYEASTALGEADTAWKDTWRTLNTTDSTLGPRLVQRAIIEEWNEYLDELDMLGVDIPSTEQLSHTSKYPEGFSPVETMHITDSLGVAMYEGTIVPSRESIIRTSKALREMGTPYSVAGSGDDAWGCVPFAQKISGNDTDFNSMFENTGRQNQSLFDTQTGDMVFLADPNAGIHQAGIFVFGGFYVSASSPAREVTVDRVGVDALASVRPGVDIINNQKAPVRKNDSLNWQCGGIEGGIEQATETWSLPIAGEYTLGAEFGDKVERLGDSRFQGAEFVTKKEQIVRSIFRGVVTKIEDHDEWGTSITIEHSDNLESRYSFLGGVTVTEGQEVSSGATIGQTGNSGSASHYDNAVALFMKMPSGYTDPVESLLSPLEGRYQNGRIPASALCRVSVGNGLLRCDAARAFEVLADAYEKDFGQPIQLTDTYRSLEGQIRCTAEKGHMCAKPGTSNHGWGLAIDFGGGINSFGTPQHQWMVENAPKFGWILPGWAQSNGSKPEPWHWEYTVR